MGKYTIVSNELILTNEINNSAKMLYMTLCTIAEDLNHIQISEKRLAEKMDISDRTIRNCLKDLENFGLIAKFRKTLKEVQTYIVIPYEIRRKVEINTDEEFEELLREVQIFLKNELDGNVERKQVEEKIDKNKTFNTYDYCKYFADKVKQEKGMVVNYSNSRTLSIMKRVTKGKSQEENLKLIDIFISVYDRKFKKQGYEFPTIESFGTSWIYNIVVDMGRYVNTFTGDMELTDEVF